MDVTDQLTLTTNDITLRHLIRDKLSTYSEYPALGQIESVTHVFLESTSNTKLTSEHRILIETRRAEIGVHGQTLTFYGFGTNCKVVDFQNAVGLLLENDLHILESSQKRGDLMIATLQFVESEVNLAIAEALLRDSRTGRPSNTLMQEYKGVVNEAYIRRAELALSTSLNSLFNRYFQFNGTAIIIIGNILGVTLYAFKWPIANPYVAYSIAVVLSLLTWLAFEYRSQIAIARKFPEPVRLRIYNLIRRGSGVKRMREVYGTVFAVILITGIFATNYTISKVKTFSWLSTTTSRAERAVPQTSTRTTQNDQIKVWLQSKEPDLQLRDYPAQVVLLKEVKEGNETARIILVWKQLLGVGGVSKNIDGAADWLAKASPRSDDYLLVAQAVLAMNQEATPDALRVAAQNLNAAANRGLLEARYWEARLYLASNNALQNNELGFRKLEQAAKSGHAHAAYYLGLRLLEGRGIEKDIARATLMLEFARSKGLLDAIERLEKLKQ